MNLYRLAVVADVNPRKENIHGCLWGIRIDQTFGKWCVSGTYLRAPVPVPGVLGPLSGAQHPRRLDRALQPPRGELLVVRGVREPHAHHLVIQDWLQAYHR